MEIQPITPEECAARLERAHRIVAVTGAGISTAAGVPDFRGPKGLYVTRRYDPEKVFEIAAFDRDPRPFYEFSRDFVKMVDSLQPTFTHRFLAALENHDRQVAVLTQNIDGLHQLAGSTCVVPLHGGYESGHCRSCGREIGERDLIDLILRMDVPRCSVCGGVIKPDVVFFGENVRCLDRAHSLCRASDLMLVLGTSLTVYPVAALPDFGGETVVVNQGRVNVRPGPGVFQADCGLDEFFRPVAEIMGLSWE